MADNGCGVRRNIWANLGDPEKSSMAIDGRIMAELLLTTLLSSIVMSVAFTSVSVLLTRVNRSVDKSLKSKHTHVVPLYSCKVKLGMKSTHCLTCYHYNTSNTNTRNGISLARLKVELLECTSCHGFDVILDSRVNL